MSRFFAKPGDSSSEDESESEEEESSEEESSEDEKPQKKAPSAFMRDEGAVKKGPRKVVSQKDKRFDEMRQTVKNLKNAMNINDWNAISNDFQKINQQVTKAAQTLAASGEGIPRFYIAAIAQLADLVETTSKDKEKVKKMSKTNAKSLNAMKQNIKKNNAQYEKEIEKYLENPDAEDDAEAAEEEDEESEEEESEEEESESESEDEKKEAKVKKEKKEKSDEDDDDDDDDDSDWSNDDSSSSSSDGGATAGLTGMSKWLKTGDDSDDDGFEKVGDKKKKDKVQREQKVKADDEEKPKEQVKEQMVLTEENVKKRMEEIQAMRGKKGTSKKDQIAQLELLATAKLSPGMTAQVLVHLIAAQFDSSMQRSGVSHMPISFEVETPTGGKVPSREKCLWTKCKGNIQALLQVLRDNPDLTEEATGQSAAQADRERVLQQQQQLADADMMMDDDAEPMQVTSNLVSFVERLDDELYLSLRLLDNHSPEFLKRLLDIAPFLSLAEQVQAYYQQMSNEAVAARIAMRRLEHLYYKHDALVARAGQSTPQVGDRVEGREAFIREMAMQVYRFGDDAIKTRAMLCQMYYHALHDRFFQARDMMLMSHLQDTIHQTNSVPTQILFNRTMAQLGLAAFRCGLTQEAHGCFDELCGNNRLKELLAQGLSSQRFNERTQEQERMEKRRQTPYHMHMNLELVECCHLVGAVLIEVPKMVANAYDSKRKVTSRALKRVFDNSDRNPLAGPPETTRDVVMAGARALEKGDWQTCERHMLSLPVWGHLGTEELVATVKTTLQRKIKEEALRTFLFAYSAYYDALSLGQLCEMFELEKTSVNSLVSKMIISDELFASWDQPTGSIVMHKKERSRLHHLSLHYSDQVGKLVEANEKAWDNRFGGYGYREQREKQGGWHQGGRGGRGGGRGGGRMGGRDQDGGRMQDRDAGRRDNRNQ